MIGYSFLVLNGPDLGSNFTLTTGTTIIGRLSTSAPEDPPGSLRWTLTDPAISRTHSQVSWDGLGAPVLVHLSTTNATLLNGRLVASQLLGGEQLLKPGDVLRMGQTEFEIQEANSGTGWVVQEGEELLSFDDPKWAEVGINFTSDIEGATISLRESGAEVYVIRKIDEVNWSTPLTLEHPIKLRLGDNVRLSNSKLTISSKG